MQVKTWQWYAGHCTAAPVVTVIVLHHASSKPVGNAALVEVYVLTLRHANWHTAAFLNAFRVFWLHYS